MKSKTLISRAVSAGLYFTHAMLLTCSMLSCLLFSGAAFAKDNESLANTVQKTEQQQQKARSSEHGKASLDKTKANKQSVVNINTDSAKTMAKKLNGIGLVKAQAIVQWREKNGSFSDVKQLLSIKGIGKATLLKNKNLIRLKS